MDQPRITLFIVLSCLIIGISPLPADETVTSTIRTQIQFHHGPQQPSHVPVLPGLNVNKLLHFGPLVGKPDETKDYQPALGDSFSKHNGKRTYHHIMTSGSWWLRAGDLPRLSMETRTPVGSYSDPPLLPDIGTGGKLRIAVTVGEQTKWLDRFDSIDCTLSPGSAQWKCSDSEMGATLEVNVIQFQDVFGYTVRARGYTPKHSSIDLTWTFGDIGKEDTVELHDDYAELKTSNLLYTQIFIGSNERRSTLEFGKRSLLSNTDDLPSTIDDPKNASVLLTAPLKSDPSYKSDSHFICVWGYRDYNRQGIEDAYQRLKFRPFDPQWVEAMVPKWFDHWIGKGLNAETKFLDTRRTIKERYNQSVQFWQDQRNRMRITTPDPRLDCVVNNISAQSRMLFEYPSFIHGLEYGAKYGKINHGYYGFDSAGMHEETADSLLFVAGTQDIKGRQRYFMPTFSISDWHEDMDFYFTEQAWYHWRWTGDSAFLNAIWPSVRRALEHGLTTSDPDGDGILTGYYEMWNQDACNFGGLSVVETAMGWSALRAAADMARTVNDYDRPENAKHSRTSPADYAKRYQELSEKVAQAYHQRLWQNDVGAWSSAEWNGVNRPRPHTCEQNYSIWRGLGDPLRNYMAIRYIRENLHRENILPNTVFEFVNDWWPVIWSHHYIANGDTCVSFNSACAAGDVDRYWPAFQTVYETAYVNTAISTAHPGVHVMEINPLFLQAVVDGLFGVQPWFGENLLVLRPSFPRTWDHAELSHTDLSYAFTRTSDGITMTVTTPQPRIVRVELPVRSAVIEARLQDEIVPYTIQPGVNCARAIVESPTATQHIFQIRTALEQPEVSGNLICHPRTKAEFSVHNASVTHVHNPQGKVKDIAVKSDRTPTVQVSFSPTEVGKYTVFLELQTGNVSWYHPLDLDVREFWSIEKEYISAFNEGGPVQTTPVLNVEEQSLHFVMHNHTLNEMSGRAVIAIAGQIYSTDISMAAGQTLPITIPIGGIWARLSPGTIPFHVTFSGLMMESEAVCWNLLAGTESVWRSRLASIDLNTHLNAELKTLFSPKTQWRTDYTGAQHGVDWRIPLPKLDEHGYVLMNNIMSLYDYGILPEQVPSLTFWNIPPLERAIETNAGIHFQIDPERILALCATQPYDRFPSEATLELDKPKRLEKLYLLTANLVKTLKCYYPGAEVAIQYTDGTEEIHSLVPPYTMPSLVQHICPKAYAIETGKLEYAHPTLDKRCYLSAIDIVLDPTRSVQAIRLRCVATETLLGIMGATALEAGR